MSSTTKPGESRRARVRSWNYSSRPHEGGEGVLALVGRSSVSGDRRRPDDPSLRVPNRRHGEGHVDAPPILAHRDGIAGIDPFTPSDALEDLWKLALPHDDPHRPQPEDLAGRVPVEPLGAG